VRLAAMAAVESILVHIERGLTLVMFAAMSVLVLAGIVFRLTNMTVPWTNELAQYCLVWLVFVGANLGAYGREHVALTILTDRLSSRQRWAWGLAAQFAFLVFCGYLVVVGFRFVAFELAMGGRTVSLPFDIPKYLISAILPLSFLGGCVHLVRQLVCDWRAGTVSARPVSSVTEGGGSPHETRGEE